MKIAQNVEMLFVLYLIVGGISSRKAAYWEGMRKPSAITRVCLGFLRAFYIRSELCLCVQ